MQNNPIKKVLAFDCFHEAFNPKNPAKIRVLPKGRRLGFTRNASIFCAGWLNDGISPILWGDTIHSNIDRYVDRYFAETFKRLGIKFTYNRQSKLLKALGGYIDFRSADNPENWEGFGYRAIVLNEAGIILKNDYLWENAVQPMMLDYPDSFVVAGGTPKGKRTKKGKHKFFELFENAQKDDTGYYYARQISSFENPLLSHKSINRMIEDLPQSVIRQEIYGEFIDNEGALLKECYIKHVSQLPEKLYYFIGIDFAISTKTQADYTSVSVVGIDKNRNVYIVEIHRFKDDRLGEIVKRILALAEKYKPQRVLAENNQFQSIIVKELVKFSNLPIKGITADVDKITRFYPMLAKYENGFIYHYTGMRNLKDYEDELLAFPEGTHDDMVDSTVYAVLGTNAMQF